LIVRLDNESRGMVQPSMSRLAINKGCIDSDGGHSRLE
jgi:hypothetical protein